MNKILMLMLVCWPVTVQGRDLYRMPPGIRIVIPKGIYQGYTFEEMKVLLKMDIDLEYYDQEIPKYKQLAETKTKIEAAQKQVIASKDRQIQDLTADRDRLSKKWSEENRLRHLAENKPNYGSWIAWGLAAAASMAAVTVGVVYAVDHK